MDERSCFQEDGSTWACLRPCPLTFKWLPQCPGDWDDMASCSPGKLQALYFSGSVYIHLIPVSYAFQSSDFHPSIFSQQLWLLASLNKLLGGLLTFQGLSFPGGLPLGATARGDRCCLPKWPSLRSVPWEQILCLESIFLPLCEILHWWWSFEGSMGGWGHYPRVWGRAQPKAQGERTCDL